MKKYYLAYGSNLNIRQMMMRCPGAELVGTTEIPGYELLFKGSLSGAYLTIEPKEGASVPAAVWATTAADEAALDRYEGCPSFYYKAAAVLPVKRLTSEETSELEVYVYIMHEERKIGIPSRAYVRTCLEGYDDFGFEPAVLVEAVKRSRRLYHEGK